MPRDSSSTGAWFSWASFVAGVAGLVGLIAGILLMGPHPPVSDALGLLIKFGWTAMGLAVVFAVASVAMGAPKRGPAIVGLAVGITMVFPIMFASLAEGDNPTYISGTRDGPGTCLDVAFRAKLESIRAGISPSLVNVTFSFVNLRAQGNIWVANGLRVWPDEQKIRLDANDGERWGITEPMAPGETRSIVFHIERENLGSDWRFFDVEYGYGEVGGEAFNFACSISGDNAPEAFLS